MTLALLSLLVGCDSPRMLEGQVVDIWGQPVADATVVIEGVVARYHADETGKFSIPTEAPVKRAMAGKDGYIKEVADLPEIAEDADYDKLTFTLYPEPEKPGFYAIGATAYISVPAQRIRMVATELRHFAGIRDIPTDAIPGAKPASFVFTSMLRPSELARMNLHLSKLSFVNKASVKGVLGPTDATVNLWIAESEVAFDLESLPSRDDYLISTRDKLGPGVYAFHAQDVLNEEDERVLMNLPKEMQVAFPFEVL